MPNSPIGPIEFITPAPAGVRPRFLAAILSFAICLILSAAPAVADGKISGKVTGAEAQPLAGIGIVLNPVSKGAVRLAGKTNKRGEFFFGLVRDGTYTLSLEGTELVPWSIALKAFDETEKKVTLEYSGRVPSNPQEFNISSSLAVTYDLVIGEADKSPAALEAKAAAAGQAVGEIPGLLQRGDFAAALSRTNESLQATPDNATLNYWKGYALFRLKDNAAAEAPLRRAIEIDPNQPGAHMILGGVLSALGRKAEAIPELQREFEMSTDPVVRQNCRVTIGRLQVELKQSEPAIATYEAVLEADPTNAEAIAQLTDLYAATKQQEKLEALVARGTEAGVADPAQLFNLGADAWNKKNFEKALLYFQKSTQADPKFAPGWKQLGYALNKQGRTPDAITAWKKYLELAGNSPEAGEIRELIAALGG